MHQYQCSRRQVHYGDVIMGLIASQITSLTIAYSNVYSDADQRKYQSSVSPAFVRGIHRGPVNSPHKWPVTRKMSPFDDVIMTNHYLWHRWRMHAQKNSNVYVSWYVCIMLDKPWSLSARWQFSVLLTHWGRDKMAVIFQTTISNAFSWMECIHFD